MSFTIPSNATAFNQNQSIWMQADIDALVAAFNLTAVWSGCAVTAQGSPDMTVAVAAGIVLVAGVPKAVTAANGTITAADGTNPRIDLVTINSSGTIVVTAGTAAASPDAPAIPANSVLLAMVYVPATDTTIAANQITDKRVVVNLPVTVPASADESDTDNTYHADADLKCPVDANTVYIFELWLQWTSGASNTPDVKQRFTFPAGATISILTMGLDTAATAGTSLLYGGENAASSPSGDSARGVRASTTVGTQVRGVLTVGSTAGTFQFEWAQNTTDATATVRKAGSFLRIERRP